LNAAFNVRFYITVPEPDRLIRHPVGVHQTNEQSRLHLCWAWY